MPVFDSRGEVVHSVFLSLHLKDVGMPLVEFGKRADAIRAKELVFVEHLRKDPAQPICVDQSHDPTVRNSKVSRARGMDGPGEFGHPAQAFVDMPSHYPWHVLSGTSVDDCCRAQRKESTIERTLSRVRATVREPQQVVVETVLLHPTYRPNPAYSWQRRCSRSARRTL